MEVGREGSERSDKNSVIQGTLRIARRGSVCVGITWGYDDGPHSHMRVDTGIGHMVVWCEIVFR